jgi:hypothetical protein
MWSSVLLLALPIALDPVRLGVNLLLISRPRPAPNLVAYWVGCVIASVVLLLVPLIVLHLTPMSSSFVHDLANPTTSASSTVRHIEIFMGAFALSIAAAIAARFFVRPRAQLPARRANTSTLVADRDAANPISRLLEGEQEVPPEGSSPIRRLLGRARNAWENGSLWVRVAIGFWAGPNPSLVLFALTTILASGAAIGTQISAGIVFIVATLAVVEIILIGNMVAPTRTQGVLRLLHDWVRAHRLKLLVAIFTVVGVALVVQGLDGS